MSRPKFIIEKIKNGWLLNYKCVLVKACKKKGKRKECVHKPSVL